jgi:hypothetical protein
MARQQRIRVQPRRRFKRYVAETIGIAVTRRRKRRNDAMRRKENAMRTLLFATAAVTALGVAAPASARVHHYYGAYGAFGAYGAYRPHRSAYDYYYAPYNPSAAYGFHGYVPNNYSTHCGQMPKAC